MKPDGKAGRSHEAPPWLALSKIIFEIKSRTSQTQIKSSTPETLF